MEEKLTIQPIRKSFINLRQMKSLTCLILPAVPTAPQIKSQLSVIHRAHVAWPLSASPASSASSPLTRCLHTRKPLSSCPHLKLSLASGPLHMLRPLLRTHFPLARLCQVLTPCVALWEGLRRLPDFSVLCALNTKCLSFSTPCTPHQPKGSREQIQLTE